jgi:SAM-dependent methyltransferase
LSGVDPEVTARVRELPMLIPAAGEPPDDIGSGHPMREVTERVARDRAAWDAALAADVGRRFEENAATWHLRHAEDRIAPLLDALDRGGDLPGPVVELGAGTGAGTELLVERLGAVVAVDLAIGMLHRLRVPGASRVQADASALPLPDRSVGTLVCLNMFLFADEVDRVLDPDGALVWVNSIGERTPIHLSAAAVADALGDGFRIVASRAAWGTWAVARRT